MSELTNPQVQNKSSAPLAGVLGLLSLLLLGIATAAAVRHNPLYSDHDTYGISKYRFIEECKDKLHDPQSLSLSLQGQTVPMAQLIKGWQTAQAGQQALLQPGDTVVVNSTGSSSTIVSGVQEVSAGKLGLLAPVLIAAKNASSERAIGQATMQCMHDKTTGKTDVVLSVGSGSSQ